MVTPAPPVARARLWGSDFLRSAAIDAMRAFIALGLFLAIVLAGQVALVCVAMGMKWDRVSLKRLITITTGIALLLGIFRLLLQ